MARDQIDPTPIETRDELVAWFEAGIKPPSEFRLGTEHEKFVFTADGHKTVPYGGERGIRALAQRAPSTHSPTSCTINIWTVR